MGPGNQSLLQKLIELGSSGIIELFGGGVEAPAFAIGAVFNCLAGNLTRRFGSRQMSAMGALQN